MTVSKKRRKSSRAWMRAHRRCPPAAKAREFTPVQDPGVGADVALLSLLAMRFGLRGGGRNLKGSA